MNRRFYLSRFSRDLLALTILGVPALVALAPRTVHADELAPIPATTGVTTPPAHATQPAPATAATELPPTAQPPLTAGSAVVQVAADDNRATIERRVGTQTAMGLPLLETGVVSVGQWEPACVAPCTVKLDTRYSYRIAGDGLVPTESFSLPRNGDHVRVDAKMGSSTARVAGVVTTVGGILAVAAGGLALVATPILHSQDVGSEGFRTAVLAGGVSALSVGVLAVGVGTFLWLTNGSTARTEIASR